MAVANAAQTVAGMQERVAPELVDLSFSGSKLWKRIETNTKVKPVSNRPFRIPTMPVQGGKFRTAGFDGSDMGVGSGPVEVPGTGTCVSYLEAFSYTALSDWANNSDEKAIEDYADLVHRMAAKTMGGYFDVLIQGAGDNVLDVAVAVGTNTITVNNANFFQNNQDVDLWTAVGGTFLGTVTILTVDGTNAVLTFATALPGSFTAGMPILVNGSSGQANSGMNGLRTFGVSTNTGLWMNVPRSSYPGMYTKPSIAVGGALTPAIVRELQSLSELAMGEDDLYDSVVAHCTPNERNQWENNALLVQRVDVGSGGRNKSADMLAKKAPTEIAGIEMIVNGRGRPGYIDFIKLDNWSRVETKPLDFYSVAGQTLFPIYGTSGGLTSSFVFYYVWVGQTYEVNTRQSSFLSGIAIQKGLFGR